MPILFPTCCHCHALPAMSIPTSLLPAVPGLHPSAALFTGRREIPALARPARPPSPALYVCVCVGRCDVPVPVNVFRALGLAVVCYAVASALYCYGRCFACVPGFGFGCSCGLLLAQPPSYALCCVLPRSLYSLHTRHTHTSHTTQTTHSPRTLHTPYIHHTPHPPHQHLSPHSTQSCAYASLRWHTTRCMPWGCTLCLLIKCDQIHPKL